MNELPLVPPTDAPEPEGEMRTLIYSRDWSQTPLGAPETWSPTLRMMTDFLLSNRFPLLLWWGPEYISIYNDAYRPILGRKHPWALGQPVSECWSEIWHILKPLIDTPFTGGPSTWIEDFELEIQRSNFTEETHFTVAYSPVPDQTAPRGIGGVLATVHEITQQVVDERRIVILRDLGARASEGRTAEEACQTIAETLARHTKDVPFALLYLIDPDRQQARLAGTAGVEAGKGISPLVISLDQASESTQGWSIASAIRSETMVTVTNLSARFSAIPASPWSDPLHTAVIVPIHSNKAHEPAGILVAGISPRLRLDDLYSSFLELMGNQIATAIADARAYEAERQRAEALAELDRAKTTFFSNVSHEFRTPLTLMLGPLEDVLVQADHLPATIYERLQMAHRNSLRLLKLVNTLLDFSRIEAGRIQAVYEPTDLAEFTAELASVFRSAMERAKLHFTINCLPINEPVYIDREMWEKIVFNLLSNAFKFTFVGEIEVLLRPLGPSVELAVRDTGTGIPAAEIPHLFERFHRVQGSRGRTYEGSGIGLALVQELVKLHSGTVRVESEVNQGTVFRVSIPLGVAHLPADRIGALRTLESTGLQGETYVEEVLRWLPEEAGERKADVHLPATKPNNGRRSAKPDRILLVDDNADMREYVRRLLAQDGYEVETVTDGFAALRAARSSLPDLVLSDVMMPGLDGFGLVKSLRVNASTREIPVILLSARAGEESRVEGLTLGADDYLIKPFSARELLTRVKARIEITRVRQANEEKLRESEERFRTLANGVPVLMWVSGLEGTEFVNRAYLEFLGLPHDLEIQKFNWAHYVHPDDREAYLNTYREDFNRRAPFEAQFRFLRHDGVYRWMKSSGLPRFTASGEFLGYVGSSLDITDLREAKAARRSSDFTRSPRPTGRSTSTA